MEVNILFIYIKLTLLRGLLKTYGSKVGCEDLLRFILVLLMEEFPRDSRLPEPPVRNIIISSSHLTKVI